MPKKKLSFEQSVKRLEDIASILESGNVSLEDSIDLYKEGITLSNIARKSIDDARAYIMEISKSDSGAVIKKPFAVTHDDL